MKDSTSRPLNHLLNPYLFVLKEGKEIQEDFLDYSLLLLQVGQPAVIPSPNNIRQFPTLSIQLIKRQS